MGWLFKSTLICALAKQIFGHRIKIVWNIRYSSFPNSDVKSRLIVQILKIFSSTVEAIVYNSFVGRRHHESLGYKNKNSIVIGNGFDIEKYQPQPHLKQEFLMNKELEKNSFIFGMVARYDKLKNQKNFILAALEFLDNIKETKGPIYFVFAGKEMNWQNQELIKILDGHPKSYRFLFLDAQNRTQFLYPCFDINCLYSLTEGFPNVIGESMCCGIPSIASDVGDVKRLMENSGWLVSLDSKSELITAFTKAYYANTSDLRELGEQARKNICENYSIEKITNDYIHLFEMIIGK